MTFPLSFRFFYCLLSFYRLGLEEKILDIFLLFSFYILIPFFFFFFLFLNAGTRAARETGEGDKTSPLPSSVPSYVHTQTIARRYMAVGWNLR